MEMLRDPLAEAALRTWPDLAGEAGLAPGDWHARPLARRDDARVARILLRMVHRDGRSLVLKHEQRPRRPDDFMKTMSAHLAAHDGCPEGVPEVLAFDVRAQSCLMAHVPGRPMSDVLRESHGFKDHLDILCRAGAWLSRFHRATIGEPRTFQPRFTIGYLGRVMDEVRAGSRTILAAEDFLLCAESLCKRQADFEGHPTVTAQTHGDLHMRNLLIGSHAVWGIDFAGGRVVPVGHDIARLLVDYATLCAPHERIPAGSVLPPEALEAFFAGYDLVAPRDPSVRLLLRHRVLADWWGLPAARRSAAQERRWHALTGLAERAFASALTGP